jgi:hypothetical protein
MHAWVQPCRLSWGGAGEGKVDGLCKDDTTDVMARPLSLATTAAASAARGRPLENSMVADVCLTQNVWTQTFNLCESCDKFYDRKLTVEWPAISYT